MRIFVLGTGRSGTHWVGHLLGSHPQIRATIEQRPMFGLATRAAVEARQRSLVLPLLRAAYIYQGMRSKPRHYADKSHPVIWFADEVADWFPSARFVAIQRSPYGTVASMLRHSRVSRWQLEWHRYSVPNPFLGIDEENASRYGLMSPAEQAALRWLSHQRQTDWLRKELGGRLLLLDYEAMVDEFERETLRLWRFLGLPAVDTSSQAPREHSRDAWRDALAEEEIAAIEKVTGIAPPT